MNSILPPAATPHRLLSCLYFCLIVALFYLNYYTAYPGIMSYDSTLQLNEAVAQKYTNWHPPIMAWWWGVMMRHLWNNSSIMALFHLSMFWGGIYCLGVQLLSRSALLAFLCLGMWFIPPLLAMSMILWKDSGMACSWFLASMLMVRCLIAARPIGIVTAAVVLLLLFYGTAVRYNAVGGLPLLCYLFACCMPWCRETRVRKTVTAIALTTALFAGQMLFTAIMTDKPSFTVKGRIGINDLYFLSQSLNEKLDPTDDMLEYMKTWEVDADKDAKLYDAYIALIKNHPIELLKYKIQIFKEFLGMTSAGTFYPYEWNQRPGIVMNWPKYYMSALADGFWFRGVYWVVLACGVSIFAWVHRRTDPIAAPVLLLNGSGLMYLSTYFVLNAGYDTRYMYWSMLAIATTTLLALSMAWPSITNKANKLSTRLNGRIARYTHGWD